MIDQAPDAQIVDESDGELLERIRARDATALQALYDRYAGQAYALATRMLRDPSSAEEVTQDAFVSVWRQAQTYNASLGRVRPWLLSIVHHRAIDQMRRQRRHVAAPLDEAWMTASHHDAFADAARSLARGELKALLEELPAAQRRAIDMVYFDGYTFAEIAQLLSVPVGTVKSRVRLGLARLRAIFAARGGFTYAG